MENGLGGVKLKRVVDKAGVGSLDETRSEMFAEVGGKVGDDRRRGREDEHLVAEHDRPDVLQSDHDRRVPRENRGDLATSWVGGMQGEGRGRKRR